MFYFSDNTNNDEKKVYYGGFETKTECKFFASLHRHVAGISANYESCLGTGYFTKDERKEYTEYDNYEFKPADKAKYPTKEGYNYKKVCMMFDDWLETDANFKKVIEDERNYPVTY